MTKILQSVFFVFFFFVLLGQKTSLMSNKADYQSWGALEASQPHIKHPRQKQREVFFFSPLSYRSPTNRHLAQKWG